jgi:hypothetical protein
MRIRIRENIYNMEENTKGQVSHGGNIEVLLLDDSRSETP